MKETRFEVKKYLFFEEIIDLFQREDYGFYWQEYSFVGSQSIPGGSPTFDRQLSLWTVNRHVLIYDWLTLWLVVGLIICCSYFLSLIGWNNDWLWLTHLTRGMSQLFQVTTVTQPPLLHESAAVNQSDSHSDRLRTFPGVHSPPGLEITTNRWVLNSPPGMRISYLLHNRPLLHESTSQKVSNQRAGSGRLCNSETLFR